MAWKLVERLWSQAGATDRNRSQMATLENGSNEAIGNRR